MATSDKTSLDNTLLAEWSRVAAAGDLDGLLDFKSDLASLFQELNRLCHKTGGRELPTCPLQGASLIEQINLCSQLLRLIDTNTTESQKRLTRAETLNHEQSLQLLARSNESHTDGLTGLANRRAFDQQFSERCLAAQHSQCPVVLALLDIDHFKSVNDTRGHHVGDAVLRGLSKVLKHRLSRGALLARYGGEEFAIVLSGLYIDDAIELVDQLRAQVNGTQFRYEGQSLAITVSCGLAQLGAQEHREQLIQRADIALYASKQAGRNRVFWHDGVNLHLATEQSSDNRSRPQLTSASNEAEVIDVTLRDEPTESEHSESMTQSTSVLIPRATRANWCDGVMLFWYIRQRLAEWKRGGDPFCVLAVDVDNSEQLVQSYGLVALHFMMRAQMLHLDATLRDMDIVARSCHSRVIVVLPNATLTSLAPLLERLRGSMINFAYPTQSGVIDYSISIGATESTHSDDAQQLVMRAEVALEAAQRAGNARFFGSTPNETWEL